MQIEKWKAWGKLNRLPGGRVLTHPLLDHMIDVAAVLEALLLLPAIQRALNQAAGRPLTDVDRARLAALTFLHDIGKANAGFQVRFWRERAERPLHWLVSECGHGPPGWALFSGRLHGARRILAGLPIERMNNWGEAVLPLLHASISHHGRPVAAEASEAIWQPVLDGATLVYDSADAVAEMGYRIQTLYPLAFTDSAAELPNASAFAHLFAGLVQLADWLGSDTRQGFFPYTQPGEDRATTAPQRARHAVRAVGLDVGDAAVRRTTTACDFAQAFGVPSPRPIQAAMADDGLGPIVVLEAETGSGKTEAALWRFLHLWRTGQVDALYFALPTRVAATQLYERVQAFVQRVWPADVAPVVVRALPGYTAADGHGYEPLPGFQVLWHDEPGDDAAERRWAAESPKRYLAATIAVGTVDQALLGALQIKHAHLRQAMLSRSLLVVDEVHASDAYMTRLSEHLLRAHVACGGQALLLSATLGAVARTRYLAIGGRRADGVPVLAAAQAMPYPAIGHRASDGPTLLPVQGNPRHKTVHWQALDIIDEPERIAELAVRAAAAGARVLVVRNTVPAAIATLQAVEALADAQGLDCLFKVGGISTLHHSRFSRQDRPMLDAEVQAQIGKHRAPRGGLVVIGTQTLEQSLDIDADLLITDLCPMDVLLQRLGRLHRHARPNAESPDDCRPLGFEEARAWVLTPPAHDLAPLLQRQRHGLGPIRIQREPMAGVYVDLRVLEATRRLIAAQPTRRIPTDNRMLVEQATHPEALDAIAHELGAAWVRFGTDYEGAVSARKVFATYHALPFDKPFDEAQFGDDKGRIGSRLGAADRLVVFDPPPQGPFGRLVEQLAIRHHLLPHGLAPDAEARNVQPLPDAAGFTFELGAAQYRYTRLGLEVVPT
ncbi:CRISPR-associated helicase Cas3' [Ottowia sp.]|uniref:CRISPR-associated helicase Cas3' n=1 Tax=Ottowia sp. TaxID=1898956 RepID=UPI0025E06212|nr:CRISPR-associated helicase Cas3' [Ottowia sp.]MBK6614651.1 CRISPR-associated helicase Cas3' [Ottowia sp.]MBK6745739.1 CRISPR-associated helicase Cas3' [Ottowia sp.]